MAEAHHVKVIPHNPLSPISTAACVQLDACIPNFALQEYTGESDPPKRDMVLQPLVLKDGYLEVPDAPGLGIELNDTALARLKLREVATEPPTGRDGSVQDW
jgi:galactonate dehydratase